MRPILWLCCLCAACGSDPESSNAGDDGGGGDGPHATDAESNSTDSDAEGTDMDSTGGEVDSTDTSESQDTASSEDSEVSPVCPDGSTAYTGANGDLFCCTESYPVFCDATDDGYEGGCWSDGVDCDTLTLCGSDVMACLDGSLPYCDEEESFVCYACPDGATQYETASGRPVCCSETRPMFCDENDAGYTGGCWSATVDCDTITVCGDSFTACHEGSLPYCNADGELTCYPCPDGAEQYETASGRPVCCTDDLPVFCDENSDGYAGGCWSDGVDCTTVIYCGSFWGACTEGHSSSCEDDSLRCISDASERIILPR